eukprot:1189088-Prorocentrum_minimum.AAC.1
MQVGKTRRARVHTYGVLYSTRGAQTSKTIATNVVNTQGGGEATAELSGTFLGGQARVARSRSVNRRSRIAECPRCEIDGWDRGKGEAEGRAEGEGRQYRGRGEAVLRQSVYTQRENQLQEGRQYILSVSTNRRCGWGAGGTSWESRCVRSKSSSSEALSCTHGRAALAVERVAVAVVRTAYTRRDADDVTLVVG